MTDTSKTAFAKRLNYLMTKYNETQASIAKVAGVVPSAVSAWCNAEKYPRMDKVDKLAIHFGITRSQMMGDLELDELPTNVERLRPMEKVPLIGTIACGTPILAEENVERYVDLPEHIKADFTLKCKGNSMEDAGIYDGDIVYIHQQPVVENGQIAAVLIDDEATLKRFYQEGDTVMLVPENRNYMPKTFKGDEINNLRIIGLAVAYTHKLI